MARIIEVNFIGFQKAISTMVVQLSGENRRKQFFGQIHSGIDNSYNQAFYNMVRVFDIQFC